jgi:hypothetical protein
VIKQNDTQKNITLWSVTQRNAICQNATWQNDTRHLAE